VQNELMDHGFGAIGYVAALLTTFSSIPQIIRVYRLKESRDISLWTASVLSAGILLWFIHGLVIGDLPVILANGASLGLSVLMLGLVVKYR
jgi:MtN3 and saliva related transmembrane protein